MPRTQSWLTQIVLTLWDALLGGVRWSPLLLSILIVLVLLPFPSTWERAVEPLAARGVRLADVHWLLKGLGVVLASVWLSLGLAQIGLGWSARQLYTGPPADDEPPVRLLPLVLYRLGLASGWTVLVVPALLFWRLVWISTGQLAVPVPVDALGAALLMGPIWWLSFVVFALCAPRQCDRLWDDLRRAEEEARQDRARPVQRDGAPAQVLPFSKPIRGAGRGSGGRHSRRHPRGELPPGPFPGRDP